MRKENSLDGFDYDDEDDTGYSYSGSRISRGVFSAKKSIPMLGVRLIQTRVGTSTLSFTAVSSTQHYVFWDLLPLCGFSTYSAGYKRYRITGLKLDIMRTVSGSALIFTDYFLPGILMGVSSAANVYNSPDANSSFFIPPYGDGVISKTYYFPPDSLPKQGGLGCWNSVDLALTTQVGQLSMSNTTGGLLALLPVTIAVLYFTFYVDLCEQ